MGLNGEIQEKTPPLLTSVIYCLISSSHLSFLLGQSMQYKMLLPQLRGEDHVFVDESTLAMQTKDRS